MQILWIEDDDIVCDLQQVVWLNGKTEYDQHGFNANSEYFRQYYFAPSA